MKNFFFLAFSAFGLIGCASQMTPQQLYAAGKPLSIGPVKAGATWETIDKDILDCRVSAAQRVPENMQIRTTPVYTSPSQTFCNTVGYSTVCNTVGGGVSGGRVYSVDVNASLRSQAVDQCLVDMGYQNWTIPPCPNGISSDQLVPLVNGAENRFGQITGRSCFIATETSTMIYDRK